MLKTMSALFSTAAASSSTSSASSSSYSPSPDALFSHIEALHSLNQTTTSAVGSVDVPDSKNPPMFGAFLDAGTGVHSLKWILSLESAGCLTSFDAVTADSQMRKNTQSTLDSLKPESVGNIIIGNWAAEMTEAPDEHAIIKNPTGYLLPTSFYDTILADYLVGAMDGFSPYYQDLMLPRLARHLNPGGRVYIVGLQPIPDEVEGPGNVVCKVRKARDACILLASEFHTFQDFKMSFLFPFLSLSSLSFLSFFLRAILIINEPATLRALVGHPPCG